MNDTQHTLRRLYQQHALCEFVLSSSRFWALLWERQAGKSTTLADFALYEMMRFPNRTVIYASASLLLSQEITLKTALRANQTISQLVERDATVLKRFADTAQSTIDAQTQNPVPPNPFSGLRQLLNERALQMRSGISVTRKFEYRRDMDWPSIGSIDEFLPILKSRPKGACPVQFKTFDSVTGKEIIGGRGAHAKQISAAGFAELFSKQRLEFRVYHSPASYSRTKVIAPNIATARSWSGTVLLDEIAFIRNLRELMTALLPVISTNQQFKLIFSTTPPEFDDTHYSFELLAPPAGLKFEPRAEGNWYQSESAVRVHRADAFDTALAGKRIFDLKTGEQITPVEAFNRAPNKDGHRIAHWLTWMLGGAAACDLLRLVTAQERGANVCQNFQINQDREMVSALNWLASSLSEPRMPSGQPIPRPRERERVAEGRVRVSGETLNVAERAGVREITSKIKIALGFDVATTTRGKSNPSVVSVMEERGPEWLVRARFVWRAKDPEIANQRLDDILDTLQRCGITPRALAQDATNERYYAEQNRKRLRKRLPVILVVASQAVDKPGLDKPTNWKEYLGQQLVAKLDDNNLTLPPDTYTRADYRLVMKDRGKFVCEPNDEGMHGDCFDADKLAGHALTASSNRRTIVPPLNLVAAGVIPL